MGNAHVHVIDHHREIIGRRPIYAGYNEVIEFLILKHHPPVDEILYDYGAINWIPEPYHVFRGLGRDRPERAAAAIITRLFFPRHLFIPQSLEPFFRTVTAVGMALLKQLFNDRTVTVKTLGLEKRPFIMIQP
jgi:hypothetical protein